MGPEQGDGAKPVGGVGTSPPMLDAEDKVTGRTVYLADIEMDGMAHARVLRSPFPHARIVSIDASEARAHPGVICVLTRDEVLADPDIDPYFGYVMRDAPVVALDKARHQGDIIAVVVAEDEMTAAEALEMVDVEYEELPAVIDTLEAMAQGAPIVQEEMKPIAWDMKPIHGTNIAHHATLMRGDVERGFAESDYIFEDTYSVPPVQHCALELHGVIANYTDDGITVWTNCQSPYPLRRELERMFKSPVRVIVPFVGGGFGSKSRDRIEATIVAAAKLARRPVRLLLSQEETFLTFIRPALTCWTKTGVKADGTLVARHHTFVADVGGYGISGPRNANNTLKVATGPYRIPHVLVDCYAVYTNKPPSAPYRGLPTTQHTMAYESQMDRMARALGIDPVEMRMKNFLREGDVHVPGDLLRSVHADECLEKVVDAIGYRDKQSSPGPDGKLRGKGLSCTIKYTITPPVPTAATQAEVALRGDGLFEALVGSVNLGQGSDTILAQITAEALGVPLDLIRVTHSDTGVTPEDNGTTASRGTFHSGNAVLDAANKVRSELIAIGSRLLEVEQGQVQVTSQGVAVNGEPSRTVGFQDLVQRHGGPIAEKGSCVVGGIYTDETGRQYPITSTFWSFASAAAEVEVSPETGEIRIVKMAAAANLGRAINPQSAKAQLEGGIAMDMGPTLFEQLVWDDSGQLLNSHLMDYPLPTMELIPEYDPILVEHPLEGAPFGAKGIGEVGAVITPAAIVNAVYDATGILFHQLPLSPHVVLAALEDPPADAPPTGPAAIVHGQRT